jgi:5-methyltetrahydropteroyltriglutamate--homocysteine methyltransferase
MKMPQGKVLIPGVISHATNVVEHPESGGRDFMGPEWVIASTDCGFPQGPFGCRGRPSIMCPKLRVLSEGGIQWRQREQ